jgi:hypothetical protein
MPVTRGPKRRRVVIRPSQFLDHRRVELPLLKNCQILKFINRLPTATCVFIKTKKSPRTLFLGLGNSSKPVSSRFWHRFARVFGFETATSATDSPLSPNYENFHLRAAL